MSISHTKQETTPWFLNAIIRIANEKNITDSLFKDYLINLISSCEYDLGEYYYNNPVKPIRKPIPVDAAFYLLYQFKKRVDNLTTIDWTLAANILKPALIIALKIAIDDKVIWVTDFPTLGTGKKLGLLEFEHLEAIDYKTKLPEPTSMVEFLNKYCSEAEINALLSELNNPNLKFPYKEKEAYVALLQDNSLKNNRPETIHPAHRLNEEKVNTNEHVEPILQSSNEKESQTQTTIELLSPEDLTAKLYVVQRKLGILPKVFKGFCYKDNLRGWTLDVPKTVMIKNISVDTSDWLGTLIDCDKTINALIETAVTKKDKADISFDEMVEHIKELDTNQYEALNYKINNMNDLLDNKIIPTLDIMENGELKLTDKIMATFSFNNSKLKEKSEENLKQAGNTHRNSKSS